MPGGWLQVRMAELSARGFWTLAVCTAAAIGLGVWAIANLVWALGLWQGSSLPVLIAGAVCVVAAGAGLWPIRVWPGRGTDKFAKAALAAAPIRLLSALILGGAVLLLLPSEAKATFGISLAGCYLLSLAGETAVLVLWLRYRGDLWRA